MALSSSKLPLFLFLFFRGTLGVRVRVGLIAAKGLNSNGKHVTSVRLTPNGDDLLNIDEEGRRRRLGDDVAAEDASNENEPPVVGAGEDPVAENGAPVVGNDPENENENEHKPPSVVGDDPIGGDEGNGHINKKFEFTQAADLKVKSGLDGYIIEIFFGYDSEAEVGASEEYTIIRNVVQDRGYYNLVKLEKTNCPSLYVAVSPWALQGPNPNLWVIEEIESWQKKHEDNQAKYFQSLEQVITWQTESPTKEKHVSIISAYSGDENIKVDAIILYARTPGTEEEILINIMPISPGGEHYCTHQAFTVRVPEHLEIIIKSETEDFQKHPENVEECDSFVLAEETEIYKLQCSSNKETKEESYLYVATWEGRRPDIMKAIDAIFPSQSGYEKFLSTGQNRCPAIGRFISSIPSDDSGNRNLVEAIEKHLKENVLITDLAGSKVKSMTTKTTGESVNPSRLALLQKPLNGMVTLDTDHKNWFYKFLANKPEYTFIYEKNKVGRHWAWDAKDDDGRSTDALVARIVNVEDAFFSDDKKEDMCGYAEFYFGESLQLQPEKANYLNMESEEDANGKLVVASVQVFRNNVRIRTIDETDGGFALVPLRMNDYVLVTLFEKQESAFHGYNTDHRAVASGYCQNHRLPLRRAAVVQIDTNRDRAKRLFATRLYIGRRKPTETRKLTILYPDPLSSTVSPVYVPPVYKERSLNSIDSGVDFPIQSIPLTVSEAHMFLEEAGTSAPIRMNIQQDETRYLVPRIYFEPDGLTINRVTGLMYIDKEDYKISIGSTIDHTIPKLDEPPSLYEAVLSLPISKEPTNAKGDEIHITSDSAKFMGIYHPDAVEVDSDGQKYLEIAPILEKILQKDDAVENGGTYVPCIITPGTGTGNAGTGDGYIAPSPSTKLTFRLRMFDAKTGSLGDPISVSLDLPARGKDNFWEELEKYLVNNGVLEPGQRLDTYGSEALKTLKKLEKGEDLPDNFVFEVKSSPQQNNTLIHKPKDNKSGKGTFIVVIIFCCCLMALIIGSALHFWLCAPRANKEDMRAAAGSSLDEQNSRIEFGERVPL